MKDAVLLIGDAHPGLGRAISAQCGMPITPMSVQTFADGETAVRIESDLNGLHACIVQPTSTPTNHHLMSLALIADAARGAGAQSITALMPYYGYARQDVRRIKGEPLSARLAARLLDAAGIDRVILLELHSPALESAFACTLLHLQADTVLVPAIRRWALDAPVIVSPDAGGLKRAQRFATALNAPVAAIAKVRPRDDTAVALQLLGEVRDRACVIVDDMASTGRTIACATQALLAAGARDVHAAFVHAVLAPGALQRISDAGVQRILSTDSVPTPDDPRIALVPVAPLLAGALQELYG